MGRSDAASPRGRDGEGEARLHRQAWRTRQGTAGEDMLRPASEESLGDKLSLLVGSSRGAGDVEEGV